MTENLCRRIWHLGGMLRWTPKINELLLLSCYNLRYQSVYFCTPKLSHTVGPIPEDGELIS